MEKPAFMYEALNWAFSFLEQNGREARAAELLMRHHLGLSWTDFHLRRRDPIDDMVWKDFRIDVERHSQGIPVQHLLGYEEFFGRCFYVNKDVLIPRPETEELVEGVLSWLSERFRPQVADIGTGSGAIAISLALELADAEVTAVDISEAAIKVAVENAKHLGAEVSFLQGDLLDPLQGKKWDAIVSNPPYIPKRDWEQLDPLVRDQEPADALVGPSEDGLDLYRAMALGMPLLLKKDGLAAFEVGAGQGKDVAQIMKEALPDARVEVRHDINGKDRMVFCERGIA